MRLGAILPSSVCSGMEPTFKFADLTHEWWRDIHGPQIHICQAVDGAGRLTIMKRFTHAIAVSGTVTMELVAANVSAVIIYRSNWLTALIAVGPASIRVHSCTCVEILANGT